ncbi:MAG: site-specific integrase [Dehalococcoidia bacterium]|nr:site-specific integrase [Dehalococcoidia bacterium]
MLQRYGGAYHLMRPKTRNSRRTVSLPAAVAVALKEHRVRQLQERLQAGPLWDNETWGGLVFATETGGPLSGFSVTRRFYKLLRVAGLPPMRYHDLRHGAASIMAALGVSPRTAMETLGHSQISTTMNIYTHVTPEHQREAMDKVGAALFGQ